MAGRGLIKAMDGKTILTVFVTLAGAAIIQWLTYIFQGKAAERQRNWALEDEKRNHEKELESEKMKLKRELLVRRLASVEEITGLMVRVLSDTMDKLMDSLNVASNAGIGAVNGRIDEINSDAWTAVLSTGSERLKENYLKISRRYWGLLEDGSLTNEEAHDWDKIRDAQLAVLEIIDDMRTVV